MANLPKPSKLLIDGFIKLQGRHNDHRLIDKEPDGSYSACALGLIYVGTGIDPESLYKGTTDTSALERQLFDGWKAFNPITGSESSISDTIVTLNDHHKWSPVQISNWLRDALGL
jgi:hypothetical protein